MRLACYGWVDANGGSVASANHVLLAELLKQGVDVDLFAHREHVPHPQGLPEEHFRYFGFAQPRWLDVVDRMPGQMSVAARKLLEPVYRHSWRRVYDPVADREHRRTPYDAVLTLGTQRLLSVNGVPSITWLQGPFHTELEAIRRLRSSIVTSNGVLFYSLLVANYLYGEWLATRRMTKSEVLILPSEWSRREMIRRGQSSSTAYSLPYPVDLEVFRPPSGSMQDWERPLVLWLGRTDPRKRLDLVLDAFPLVREEVPGVRLRVVGRAGYAPATLRALLRSPDSSQIEYSAHMPRSEVLPLLQEACVLVQPSENENFGSAVAEAQACGVPVVVGPSNGTREYIDECSAVCDAYSPESLARAIVSTLARRREHPEETQRSARASAEVWFSAGIIATRLIEILEATIHRTSVTR